MSIRRPNTPLLSPQVVDPAVDVDVLAGASKGLSGADVLLACREASMMPVRRLLGGWLWLDRRLEWG